MSGTRQRLRSGGHGGPTSRNVRRSHESRRACRRPPCGWLHACCGVPKGGAHHLVVPHSIAAHLKMWCPVCWQPDDMIAFDSEAQGGQLPAEEAARGRLGGGTFAEVQQLEHHWDELSDERKTTFAQMAMLTRSVRHHILVY